MSMYNWSGHGLVVSPSQQNDIIMCLTQWIKTLFEWGV